MRSSAGKIQLASLDELFGTTQAPSEPFQEIPLSDLHPFKGHPFHVVDDEKMQELSESVAQYGVLVPGIVRPRPEDGYSPLDYGAIVLYSLMVERAGLSARNADKFTDKNGRFFIIYTVEQMKQHMQRSRPTVIKWTKQLEEIGLIEKVRQGQGKPSKIYINDFASVKCPPEADNQEDGPQEVKKVDTKKSKNCTSGSQEVLSLEVKNLYPIELENKDLEKKDLPSLREDVEEVVENVRDQVEYPLLRQEYGQDLADEVVSIISEVLCRNGPTVRIGQDSYPADFAKARMLSVGYEHAAYALDILGRAGPVRNAHN